MWGELARSFAGDREGLRRAVAQRLYAANRASLGKDADWNALPGFERSKWIARAGNVINKL